MKIIIGLGNIGDNYKNTRHNVGFMAVEALSSKMNVDFKQKGKFESEIAEGQINGEKVILVKPTTYMNLSGNAVQKVAHFYNVKPEDIIIIYDDIDLPIGTIRLRESGSAGTHNGVKSVLASLNTVSVPRIRIGVESRGTLNPTIKDISDFVLSGFSKEEKPIIAKAIDQALEALSEYLSNGMESAMQKFN